MISDRRDQREHIPFQVITAADIDLGNMQRRWFAEDTGIGCTYLRTMDLRWINVGVPGHGATRIISADERTGSLFRVCSGCGKLDTDTGRNKPHEHRAWCLYRTAITESTATIALSRTLRTQGLLIRLPHAVTLGDDFAVPSIAAALLLGLREQVGGHPDHIRVEHVIDRRSATARTTTTRFSCMTWCPAALDTWPIWPLRSSSANCSILHGSEYADVSASLRSG